MDTTKVLTRDETDYLMSLPEMARIIRQGQEDIKNGRGVAIAVENLWKQ